MTWGTLYVVGTPLGNLGDLSARAGLVLAGVPVVAAEDTRRTRGLLSHLGSGARLLSCHAHSPPGRIQELVELLRSGSDLALVTDAGTPGVSDPGPALVAAVRDAGGPVVPVAGPSAVTAALSVAGVPADRYLFLGFLPRKGTARRRLLDTAVTAPWPVVLFEAPGRLGGLLTDLREAAGAGRTVVVARELTKLHEEIRSGTLDEQVTYWGGRDLKGEITVVLAAREAEAEDRQAPTPEHEITAAIAAGLTAGLTRREITGRLAATFGLSRNDAYRRVQEHG